MDAIDAERDSLAPTLLHKLQAFGNAALTSGTTSLEAFVTVIARPQSLAKTAGRFVLAGFRAAQTCRVAGKIAISGPQRADLARPGWKIEGHRYPLGGSAWHGVALGPQPENLLTAAQNGSGTVAFEAIWNQLDTDVQSAQVWREQATFYYAIRKNDVLVYSLLAQGAPCSKLEWKTFTDLWPTANGPTSIGLHPLLADGVQFAKPRWYHVYNLTSDPRYAMSIKGSSC